MFGEFMMCEYWLVVAIALFVATLFYNIKLNKKIKERVSGDAALIKNAYFHKLTQLPNKKNIEIIIHEQIERSKRHDKSFLVAVIEVLNYQEEKITTLSHIIQESLRDEDIVAHIEENLFLVLFNEYLEEDNFSILLHRLQRNIHESKEFHVAIGKSQYPRDAQDVNGLIYEAKRHIKK